MEQLELVLLLPFNQNIDGLIPTFGTKGMIDLCTAEEKGSFQILEMVFFQEGRVCETTDLAGPIGEGVADVRCAEAVSDAGISCFRFAIQRFDLGCPLWYLPICEASVLGFPDVEVEAGFTCAWTVSVKEDGIVLKVVETKNQVSSMYRSSQ